MLQTVSFFLTAMMKVIYQMLVNVFKKIIWLLLVMIMYTALVMLMQSLLAINLLFILLVISSAIYSIAKNFKYHASINLDILSAYLLYALVAHYVLVDYPVIVDVKLMLFNTMVMIVVSIALYLSYLKTPYDDYDTELLTFRPSGHILFSISMVVVIMRIIFIMFCFDMINWWLS